MNIAERHGSRGLCSHVTHSQRVLFIPRSGQLHAMLPCIHHGQRRRRTSFHGGTAQRANNNNNNNNELKNQRSCCWVRTLKPSAGPPLLRTDVPTLRQIHGAMPRYSIQHDARTLHGNVCESQSMVLTASSISSSDPMVPTQHSLGGEDNQRLVVHASALERRGDVALMMRRARHLLATAPK
jgi:hypothetical protein